MSNQGFPGLYKKYNGKRESTFGERLVLLLGENRLELLSNGRKARYKCLFIRHLLFSQVKCHKGAERRKCKKTNLRS
jgi:hypothetical protein